MSLLEKAKSVTSKQRRQYTEDEIELAVAWAHDGVTLTQVASVMEVKSNNGAYMFLAMALREYLKNQVNK